MARDRTVDVSSSTTGTRTQRIFRRGLFYREELHGGILAESQSRKRVPVGGTALPEREKPFLHTRTVCQWPSGSLMTRQDSIYSQLWEGSLGSGAYGNDGGTTQFGMGYPYGVNRHSPGVAPSVNPDLLSQAEVKALNKLRDKTDAADLDVGLWYAERRETAELFRDGAVGFLNLARAISQKDYKKSAQVLKDAFGVSATPSGERARQRRVEKWLKKELKKTPSLAQLTYKSVENAWLGYNLGLSPLLDDLQGAHQALLRGTLPERMVIKSVSRHGVQEQGQDVQKFGSVMPWQVETTLSHQHGYTVTLKASPLITEIARLQRLGLTNPLGTLYQATRLTFILDYFLKFGQYLEALNVPLGFMWVEGSWTHRIVTNVTFTCRSYGGNVAKGRWTRNHCQRKLYTNFPVPIPPLSLSGKDLTAKQATNTGVIALKSLRELVGVKW